MSFLFLNFVVKPFFFFRIETCLYVQSWHNMWNDIQTHLLRNHDINYIIVLMTSSWFVRLKFRYMMYRKHSIHLSWYNYQVHVLAKKDGIYNTQKSYNYSKFILYSSSHLYEQTAWWYINAVMAVTKWTIGPFTSIKDSDTKTWVDGI